MMDGNITVIFWKGIGYQQSCIVKSIHKPNGTIHLQITCSRGQKAIICTNSMGLKHLRIVLRYLWYQLRSRKWYLFHNSFLRILQCSYKYNRLLNWSTNRSYKGCLNMGLFLKEKYTKQVLISQTLLWLIKARHDRNFLYIINRKSYAN